VRDERSVDDPVVKAPDEDGRHQPTILSQFVNGVVDSAGQQHILVHAGHLVVLAAPSEQVTVGFGLPVSEPGAGPGAGRAALLSVDTVVEPQLLLKVERDVFARGVVVADDVVGAGDHTTSTTGAQARVDDLVV